jgi:hypothetical protein
MTRPEGGEPDPGLRPGFVPFDLLPDPGLRPGFVPFDLLPYVGVIYPVSTPLGYRELRRPAWQRLFHKLHLHRYPPKFVPVPGRGKIPRHP